MKSLLALIFLGLGIGVGYYAYIHGQANKQCDCACDERFEAIPNSPVFYFLKEYDHVDRLPVSYCQVISYSAPRVPLYIDLYAIAATSILVSLFVATKTPNNPVI